MKPTGPVKHKLTGDNWKNIFPFAAALQASSPPGGGVLPKDTQTGLV